MRLKTIIIIAILMIIIGSVPVDMTNMVFLPSVLVTIGGILLTAAPILNDEIGKR